jgi:hypothetical protein
MAIGSSGLSPACAPYALLFIQGSLWVATIHVDDVDCSEEPAIYSSRRKRLHSAAHHATLRRESIFSAIKMIFGR